jgi:hypothetical protein
MEAPRAFFLCNDMATWGYTWEGLDSMLSACTHRSLFLLQAEKIFPVQKIAPASIRGSNLDQTLLCFVLVDPSSQHAFCSRYDFGPWPLLEGVEMLPPHVMQVNEIT